MPAEHSLQGAPRDRQQGASCHRSRASQRRHVLTRTARSTGGAMSIGLHRGSTTHASGQSSRRCRCAYAPGRIGCPRVHPLSWVLGQILHSFSAAKHQF